MKEVKPGRIISQYIKTTAVTEDDLKNPTFRHSFSCHSCGISLELEVGDEIAVREETRVNDADIVSHEFYASCSNCKGQIHVGSNNMRECVFITKRPDFVQPVSLPQAA